MNESRVRKIESIQQHILRMFPLNNSRRYKGKDVLGMHRFISQVLATEVTGIRNEGSGSIDPKAFGTLVHDQVAAWTAWTPTPRAPTLRDFTAQCMPQVRQLISFFQEKRYVGIGANVVVADPLLNYATPVDILMVPIDIPKGDTEFAYLVELKTTHTLQRKRARPCLYPISQYLECETPETFASLQATLPCIRMNEIISADVTCQNANLKLRIVPLVVVVRMDSHQTITNIEEFVVPLGMQTTAFRNQLNECLPQLRIETSSKLYSNKKYKK